MASEHGEVVVRGDSARRVRDLCITAERRQWILGIIAAVRAAQSGRPVSRSHEQVRKCQSCSVRTGCSDALS